MFPILKGQRRIRSFFDWMSIIYDSVNPHLYSKEMKETLINEIEGNRILDVGVGTGYSSKEFENAIGIDLSKKMLRKAKDYKGALILADATQPPFKPESFDTIISAGSFYYLPSPLEALKVFHSLLKEKGVLLSITPNIKSLKLLVHVYSKAELEELFNLSNFKVEKIMKVGWRGIAYFSKVRKIDR